MRGCAPISFLEPVVSVPLLRQPREDLGAGSVLDLIAVAGKNQKSSNTYIASRHPVLLTPQFEDAAHIQLDLSGVGVSALTKLLDTRDNGSLPPTFFLGETTWAVTARAPAALGKFGARVVLQNGGIILALQRSNDKNVPVRARLVCPAHALLVRGSFDACWSWFQQVLASAHIAITAETVSRVDIATDVDHPYSDFHRRYEGRWYITRASTGKHYHSAAESTHGRSTGFTIGSDPQLRVYDKTAELRKADPVKRDLQQQRWRSIFGSLPHDLTRGEFQLRRTALKKLGVLTVADWQARRLSIWSRLTRDFFRFTDGPVDRQHGNQRRAPTWPVWEAVQALSDQAPAPLLSTKGRPNPRAMEDRALLALLQPLLLEKDWPKAADISAYVERVLRDRQATENLTELVVRARQRLITNYGADVLPPSRSGGRT